MVGWEREVEVIASDGVVNGIGVNVWSVEKNGVICPFLLPRRNGGGVVKNGVTYPPHWIDVGKNDWVGHPLQIESDAFDASSHCFSGSLPLPRAPYASFDDSFLYHGPSLDPSHEKTHPSTASPFPPLQPPQLAASSLASQPHPFPLGPPGPLEFGL